MRIDKRLKLVIPVVRDSDGAKIFVHSTPISLEVFETYHFVIAKTWAFMQKQGLDWVAAPRNACLILRDIAKEMGKWDTPDGIERGLLAEIHRLTNVLCVSEKGGWESRPFDDAVKNGILEKEDVSEVDSLIVFFTVGWFMYPKVERTEILSGALSLRNVETTLLDCTGFRNSLKTSTEAETSPWNPPESSATS